MPRPKSPKKTVYELAKNSNRIVKLACSDEDWLVVGANVQFADRLYS